MTPEEEEEYYRSVEPEDVGVSTTNANVSTTAATSVSGIYSVMGKRAIKSRRHKHDTIDNCSYTFYDYEDEDEEEEEEDDDEDEDNDEDYYYDDDDDDDDDEDEEEEEDGDDDDEEEEEEEISYDYSRNNTEYLTSQFDSTSYQSDSVTSSSVAITPVSSSSSNMRGSLFWLFIQMEFCENKTLREAIDNGAISDEQVAKHMFHQIVEGVSQIHSKNIIHRDLKPANIFIGDDNSIKIGDFGLSTVAPGKINAMDFLSFSKSKPTQTTRLGTPLYIAPELLNSPEYDYKVDMYSLGIIYFEMCNHFNTKTEALTVIYITYSLIIIIY